MQKNNLVFVFAVTVCLAGCFTPRFHAQNVVSQLQPGVSTLNDATALLGEPIATSMVDSGTLVQWIDIKGWPFRDHGAHLAIIFDGSNKMVRVTHSFDSK
ncbi:MAG: hypothetical protein ABWY27_15890 [Telluria sp.]